MTLRVALSPIVALLAALLLGACGSGSALLREPEATGLKDTLEQVRSAVDERNCGAATARLRELRAQIGALGPPVDRGLRVRLGEEVRQKLAPAVIDQCDDDKVETVQTTTTPAPTVPAEPPPEATTTTEEAPPPASIPEPTPVPTEPQAEPPPLPAEPAPGSGGISPDQATP